MELRPFGIDVVVIEPGPVRTEWNEIAQDALIALSEDGAYGSFAQRHAMAMDTADRLGSPPDAVAATIAHAVQARRPRGRYVVGGTARLILLIRRLLSDRMFDRLAWGLSQRLSERTAVAAATKKLSDPAAITAWARSHN